MTDADIQLGIVLGDYRVIGRLEAGSYRAVHVENGKKVDIEVAPAEGRREAAIRMLRAASIVEAIQHPGVARIVARGVIGTGRFRRPWMATEVRGGIPLEDLVATRPLPPGEVAALIRDAADVLAHAHIRGVVHRALMVRSIVLATGERAYPLCIAGWGQRVTELGVYAAPEGAAGDGRVDVYALGVIAFRAATRRFPTGAETIPGAPAGLATLVERMLARDPDERPTAAEVRALATLPVEAGDGDPVASAMAEAARAAETSDELPAFADDEVTQVTPPRFATPRWTPAPPLGGIITSERASSASGEIVVKPEPD